jgi:colanic acid biosynthesis glycosyl transferase WcaI
VHILIVTQYFWPESFRINDLATALTERGHGVTVLTGMPNYPDGRFFKGYGPFSPSREHFGRAHVYRVPLVSRGRSRGLRLVLNYLSFAIAASVLGPLRCRCKFDVILVYGPSPVTVALPAVLMRWLKRAPLMFWVQDLWPESLAATGAVSSPWILGLIAKLVAFIYRRCDRILAQSQGFIARIAAVSGDPDRIRYFPNWAEMLYRPTQLDANAPETREMPAGFRIMFAGNLGTAQSFETILAAAERLKGHREIFWVILGDGHAKDWIQQQITARGLGGQVRLLGQRPVQQMPRYFSLADALLVTLRRDPIFALTVPSKIQSYLACGRPIVAALDGEGAAVVEKSKAGLICAAEDSAGLSENILLLYRMSRAEREAMGMRGRQYYEATFERERLLDQLEGWMHELAGGGQCVS